jgi:hypothetical protein
VPVDHENRALKWANFLCMRFRHFGDEMLLYEVINLGREALSLTLLGHPDRAEQCINLSGSLHTRPC